MPESISYLLSPAESVNEIMSKEFNVPLKKIIGLGYPRNDILVNGKKEIRELFGKKYDKIIVWYPTFRQSKVGLSHGKNMLPIIHDMKNAIEINKCAKKNNVLIVLKPHFAQDITNIKKLNLSNIILIDDSFFVSNQISSYEFLSGCDALITDYSSVYYDFTLCNKQIAVIWEDLDEYKKSPGIAVDLDVFLKGAEKIYSSGDFCDFVENIAMNIDRLERERNEVKQLVNYTDGNSSKRVVNFIMKNVLKL